MVAVTRWSKGREMSFSCMKLIGTEFSAPSDMGTGFPVPLVVPMVWMMRAFLSVACWA